MSVSVNALHKAKWYGWRPTSDDGQVEPVNINYARSVFYGRSSRRSLQRIHGLCYFINWLCYFQKQHGWRSSGSFGATAMNLRIAVNQLMGFVFFFFFFFFRVGYMNMSTTLRSFSAVSQQRSGNRFGCTDHNYKVLPNLDGKMAWSNGNSILARRTSNNYHIFVVFFCTVPLRTYLLINYIAASLSSMTDCYHFTRQPVLMRCYYS